MAVLRGLGWLLLLATAAIGVYEIMEYIDSGDHALTAVGELWFKIHAPSLNLMQAVVERYIHEEAWNTAVRPVLLLPALVFFGGAAAFCLVVGYVFRRRDDSSPAARRRRRRR